MASLCGCALPTKEHGNGMYMTVDSVDKLPPGAVAHAVPYGSTPSKQHAMAGSMPRDMGSPGGTQPVGTPIYLSPSTGMQVSQGTQQRTSPAGGVDTESAKVNKGVTHGFGKMAKAFQAAGKTVASATVKATKEFEKAAVSAVGSNPYANVRVDSLHLSRSRNDRNNLMMHEVATFARQVQLLHYDISTWSSGVDAGLNTMKAMLDAPLPIPYDHTENGVQAFDPVPHPVGHSVTTSAMPKAVKLMKAKLEEECLTPLALWMDSVAGIQGRNFKCHKLGLDVDAQTLVLARAADKVARAQQAAPGEPGLVPEATLEACLIAHQTEEDVLLRLEQRFDAMEGDVFNHLLDVTKDAQVVREYAAAALIIMQGAVHSSLAAFDLDADPDPYKLPPAAVPGVILPKSLACVIPMANMKSAGLYTHREGLVIRQADPILAAMASQRFDPADTPSISPEPEDGDVSLPTPPATHRNPSVHEERVKLNMKVYMS
ncbi:hypothetical protein FOA52_015328 [Chlamydomonas sp. UWO 241]|nr:hypothetical protein FOA52_015328 [Chlamydomonas sp. UWO 241]